MRGTVHAVKYSICICLCIVQYKCIYMRGTVHAV